MVSFPRHRRQNSSGRRLPEDAAAPRPLLMSERRQVLIIGPCADGQGSGAVVAPLRLQTGACVKGGWHRREPRHLAPREQPREGAETPLSYGSDALVARGTAVEPCHPRSRARRHYPSFESRHQYGGRRFLSCFGRRRRELGGTT